MLKVHKMNNEDCIILSMRQPSKGERSPMVVSLAKNQVPLKEFGSRKD